MFFWANTVPYKPIGNKAWSMAVKKRFQPLMRAVLARQWRGNALITLGREALLWFGIGQSRDMRRALEAFWRRDDRLVTSVAIGLETDAGPARAVHLHARRHATP